MHREDHHRHRRLLAPEPIERLEPANARKIEVEQDQTDFRVRARQRERGLAVARLQHLNRGSERREQVMHPIADQRMVVDDENLHDALWRQREPRALA